MRHRLAIAFAMSLLCAALTGVSPASAGISLGVSPAILDLSAPAGGSGSIEIIVDNDGSDAFEIDASIFELDGRGGTSSAVTWADISPDDVLIAPGTSGALTLSLDVPDATTSGGYYAAVSIATRAPSQDRVEQNVSGISGRIVVPVLVTVIGDGPGSAPEALPVLDRAALFLATDGSLSARVAVRNDGDTHAALRGATEVRVPDAPRASDPLDSAEVPMGRVLPGDTRVYAAFTPFTLEPDQTYLVHVELGEGDDRGAYDTETVIDTAFEAETTPRISLGALALCSSDEASLTTSIEIVNEGTLGVVPEIAFWVERSDGSRVAAAQRIPAQLSWPADRLVSGSTIERELAVGEYLLVAEVAYGLDGLARAELPFGITGAAADVPRCTGESDAVPG
jgi:hypothetical protein